MSADDRYEARNDPTGGDVPSGDVKSSDYVTGGPIPVQKDDAPVEQGLDPATVDSDKQLEADEKEIIGNKQNMLKERTRGAKPQGPGYSEGPDEGDLPKAVADGNDGTSAIATKAV